MFLKDPEMEGEGEGDGEEAVNVEEAALMDLFEALSLSLEVDASDK